MPTVRFRVTRGESMRWNSEHGDSPQPGRGRREPPLPVSVAVLEPVETRCARGLVYWVTQRWVTWPGLVVAAPAPGFQRAIAANYGGVEGARRVREAMAVWAEHNL